MELNLLTIPIGTEEKLLDTAVENPFDLDLNLPEYYPDIQRILKCSVQANLHAVSVGTDRVTAEGGGVFRMVYMSEDKRITSFEQTFPISRSAPFSCDDPQACVSASAQTDFVNCRATGQRRALVHGVVSVRICAYGKRSVSLVTGTQDPTVQLRTQNVRTWDLAALAVTPFAMSEVVEVGGENPSVGRILRTDAAVRTDTVKAVKDKLLIKGELTAEILYAPDDDGDYVCFRHTMPVSQIVQAQGLAENNLHDVVLRIVSMEVTPKADGGGEQRLLEIALRVEASVRSGVFMQTQTVSDAYSTSGTIRPQYGDITFLQFSETIRETITVKQTVDALGEDVTQILDVQRGPVQASFRMDGDTAVTDCTTTLGFLCRNKQGEGVYTEKQIAFAFRKIAAEGTQCAVCSPNVQISACKGVLTSDGCAEVRMEAFVCGTVYQQETRRVLLDASVDPSEDAPPAALTIYYADAGESVWDVARRYKTTVQAILDENALTEETIPEARMLVIPTA